MRNLKNNIIALIFLLASSHASLAGGPGEIEGPNGNTPVTYENPNITLHVENGDIGTLSNADAIPLMEEALDLWNTISSSTINLSLNTTLIGLDIDQDNAEDYLPAVNLTELNEADNLNPVIFDSDGKIIELYFGLEQSTSILGFSNSIIDVNRAHFLEGYIVLNGKTIDNDSEFKMTFAHETAHFFGLDHTQVDINNEESFTELPFFCITTSFENYPLMYPVSCRDVETLHPDDISAASALYPASSINDDYGILEGRFVDETGAAILGANIWVENTATGDTYSIVSDYLKQGNGFYRLHIPAGSYTLHANSINTAFTGGSSVGPYSDSSSDASFTAPHPIPLVNYHGSTEPNDEVITITSNQTLTINFSSIGALVTIPTGGSGDEDDSIADLFGATSQLTLLILSVLLLAGRQINRSIS